MRKNEMQITCDGFVIEVFTMGDNRYATKISNQSNHDIEIYVRPEKPKRKIIKVFLIPANSFKMFEYLIDKSQILIGYIVRPYD